MQPVVLEIDGESKNIAGRATSVAGPVAGVTPDGDLPGSLASKLDPGSLGFLLFDSPTGLVGLRGVVRSAPDATGLEFIVVDGVQLPERRTDSRVKMTVAVRVEGDGATGPVETVATNLSTGGALLLRRPGLLDAGSLQLELQLPDAPPISCQATIAHHTNAHVGVAFSAVEADDLVRLAGLIADRQRAAATH